MILVISLLPFSYSCSSKGWMGKTFVPLIGQFLKIVEDSLISYCDLLERGNDHMRG